MHLGIVTLSLNQATFLPESLDSVGCSAPHRLSYVVVDPGSADGSREILESRRHQLSACILEPDRGPGDGLNKGFAACSGEVLGYINADDAYAPGALDFVASFFEAHPAVDVLLGACEVIDERGRPRFARSTSSEFARWRLGAGIARAQQPATFFRRAAFERTTGFNNQNRTCWDYELAVDLLLTGARFRTVDKVLGRFRIHGGSITGSGRLAAAYQVERDRLDRRLAAAGIVIPPRPARWALQLAARLDPWRRLKELVVR